METNQCAEWLNRWIGNYCCDPSGASDETKTRCIGIGGKTETSGHSACPCRTSGDGNRHSRGIRGGKKRGSTGAGGCSQQGGLPHGERSNG